MKKFTKFLSSLFILLVGIAIFTGCKDPTDEIVEHKKIEPYVFHDTVTILPSGTTGSYGTEGIYVEFGDWPQDVVPEAEVAKLKLETSTDKVIRGYLEFVLGADGNYYVKCAENASELDNATDLYMDGTAVGHNGTSSRWFKVMPIKWRVVDEAYKDASGSSQGKLLVAENILTDVVYYEDTTALDEKHYRIINGKHIQSNNYMYSQIRAYLNGNTYPGYDTSSETVKEQTRWENKGFLQAAFTSEVIDKIITTKVDNSEDSTTDIDGKVRHTSSFVCDPTDDKIFLLSLYEVTKYSKEKYNEKGIGNSRIRLTTDFAKANNAYQSSNHGEGGVWRLRSPKDDSFRYSYIVYTDGTANEYIYTDLKGMGVVPALVISF